MRMTVDDMMIAMPAINEKLEYLDIISTAPSMLELLVTAKHVITNRKCLIQTAVRPS